MSEKYLSGDEDSGRPLIHRAVGRGDIETVKQLLEADPSLVNVRNELTNQPLHEACWAKQAAIVELLINNGADVNARGDFAETPLHYAVWDGGEEAARIVSILLRHGADIEAVDERLWQNALGFALRESKDELEPRLGCFANGGLPWDLKER